MLVQWTTRDRGSPSVRWGTMSGQLSFTSSAATDTYTRQDMCGGVANSTGFINPGLFHTAKMSGLAPDTQYFYAYGSPVRSLILLSLFSMAPAAVFNQRICLCQPYWIAKIFSCLSRGPYHEDQAYSYRL